MLKRLGSNGGGNQFCSDGFVIDDASIRIGRLEKISMIPREFGMVENAVHKETKMANSIRCIFELPKRFWLDVMLSTFDVEPCCALDLRLLDEITWTQNSHIKSGNVSIVHLRTYLTIAADREDDITIVRTFILFMMGYLWFQTANDAVPLGYLTAVNDLDSAAQYDWGSAILASLYHGLDTAVTTDGAITGFVQLLPYWFYEYCGVGHLIVKEDVKYHIDHRTVETITWEPWFDSAVSETEDVLNTKLLSRRRMSLQVPNGNNEYYLGDRCWRQVTGEDAQRLQNVEDELAISRRQIDSIDHQLYAHDLQLRRGRDVRVVPLPPGGGTRTRQYGSGPQTRGGSTSRRGRGTGDNSE
ncbi:hypothetical protein GIB67_000111 [Kingdonia uniflora]|uniref:Aminotransferase-like plant mobile domain-containing protein n=1 Tax=Kingdonia uniflora TaxID=39325 RepID=A0A7J7M5T7_9MAGN|nr:hypothetical protein GIB67_000111 [Kingdonia uniflora]